MSGTGAVTNDAVSQLSATARQSAQSRDWNTVENCARQLLQMVPGDPEGHFLSGLVFKAANTPLKAADAFEHALALESRRYDAAIELAGMYSIARRNADAAALLGRYQDRLSNSPRYLDMAGTIFTEIGLAERAWPLYQKANELQPGIDLFEANLAACGVYLGKIEEAKVIYRRLLQRFPSHQRNHYHLSRLGTATDAAHVQQMRDILDQTLLPPDKNIFLYYAIGKELEDLERWDEAFAYYQRAGDAVAQVANYDVSVDLELLNKISETCHAQWIASGTDGIRTDGSGKTPIFVVGLPRTGTTLIDRILSSHSRVESLGETLFMQMIIRKESGVHSIEKMTPAMIEAAAGKDIRLIAKGYLDSVQYRLTGKPMFTDKLPFNILYLGFIAKAFPDARIVHLNRNPMDTCFAMYKQVFTWAYKFSYKLEDLGRYYVAHRRLLQHWREVLGERLIDVEYEALAADPEGETRKLLDRIGLEFEDSCLQFDTSVSATTTASSVQVREKIHNRSVNRWTHFRKHLQPLQRILEDAGIEIERPGAG